MTRAWQWLRAKWIGALAWCETCGQPSPDSTGYCSDECWKEAQYGA